ncbi:putative glycoprotein/receptor precursor [Candidatus Burkholderia pumila]|uniref:Glycoprotein/receptor n=1 Tax=Candidatus Burkholderia pumila TaxID=1090375 RepID=A0ABR5HNV9_9BURK|nr:putative glycoprotein/receptor precursor [Candidatus Burkholderia pumila]
MLVATLSCAPVAHAQLSNLLNQGKDSAGGGLGGLTNGMSLGSLTSNSIGNVAGVLQLCAKNNYLGGDTSSVKDGLMSKLGGSSSSDGGYKDGAKGILDSGSGKKVDLSGGGLKEQVAKQVCDKILQQGKSML